MLNSVWMFVACIFYFINLDCIVRKTDNFLMNLDRSVSLTSKILQLEISVLNGQSSGLK